MQLVGGPGTPHRRDRSRPGTEDIPPRPRIIFHVIRSSDAGSRSKRQETRPLVWESERVLLEFGRTKRRSFVRSGSALANTDSSRLFPLTKELMLRTRPLDDKLIHLSSLKGFALLVLMLASCKRLHPGENVSMDAGAPKAPSKPVAAARCDQRATLGTCMDFIKVDAASRTLCESSKSLFAQEPCPKDGIIGSCSLPDDVVKHYYDRKKDAGADPKDDAQSNCKMLQGTFEAALAPVKPNK
jgi:hypothetical protein